VAELFGSGRVVDLILALIVLEALALALIHRRTGRGIAPADFLPTLLAGACLLLALRAALAGSGWVWIAAALAGALAAHLADLRRRATGRRSGR
jgi:hypothetical protein